MALDSKERAELGPHIGDGRRVSSCSFCGQQLGGYGYHFSCHLCGASYCFIHMRKHDHAHPRTPEIAIAA